MKSYIFKLAYCTTLLGWFPFMFLAAVGSWNRHIAVIVLCVGLVCCFMGSIFALFIIRSKDLFRTIEELEEERSLLAKKRAVFNQLVVDATYELVKKTESSLKE